MLLALINVALVPRVLDWMAVSARSAWLKDVSCVLRMPDNVKVVSTVTLSKGAFVTSARMVVLAIIQWCVMIA